MVTILPNVTCEVIYYYSRVPGRNEAPYQKRIASHIVWVKTTSRFTCKLRGLREPAPRPDFTSAYAQALLDTVPDYLLYQKHREIT